MPAPTKAQIDTAIRAAFITNGLTKKEIQEDGSVLPLEPPQFTLEQETLIAVISEGINTFWVQWQATQTITSPVQVNTDTGTGATIPTPGSLP